VAVYTDYLHFVDETIPKIVEVELVAYDQNKYVTVRYGGELYEIKSGYLYATPSKYDDSIPADWEAINALPYIGDVREV
jgi:hypothetical protein